MAARKKTSGRPLDRPGPEPAVLKPPKGSEWIARPLTLSNAAILTMGWEPMPKLRTVLAKKRPIKFEELKHRVAALESAFGTPALPSVGRGLRRLVSLRSAFEFALSRNWEIKKAGLQMLKKAAALEQRLPSGTNSNRPDVGNTPPAPVSRLVEVIVPTRSIASTVQGMREKTEAVEPTSRLEQTLLRSLGALAVVLRDTLMGGKGSHFLKGDKLNVSAVAKYVAATVGQASGSGAMIPGYTERTMHLHISNALKEYFSASKNLFDLEDASELEDPRPREIKSAQ